MTHNGMHSIVCSNCNHHIPYNTSDEKFWANVNKLGSIPDSSKNCIGNCWEWTGALNHNGYGVFGGGRDTQRTTAHRKSYTMANGPIPKGLFVCHKCDNRKCINPQHLFIGTAKDNMLDALAKGRLYIVKVPLGENNALSKLTNEDINQIMIWNTDGYSARKISKLLDVSPSSISMVLLGRTWNHITGFDKQPINDGQSRGSKHPNSILTEDDVLAIRRDYALGKKFYQSYKALSIKYGVKTTTIRDICKRYRWKHIP